jgi:hypothetical protein
VVLFLVERNRELLCLMGIDGTQGGAGGGVGLFHKEVFVMRNLMKDQPAKKRRGLALTVLKGCDTLMTK